MVIVLNCPGCKKRYEIDGALAGKKSRCKQCGEVFRIPVPTGRFAEPSGVNESPASASRPGPSPGPSPLVGLLDGQPAAPRNPTPAASSAFRESSLARTSPKPAHDAFDTQDLPPPPRASYSERRRKASAESLSMNPDLGITVAWWFFWLNVLVHVCGGVYWLTMQPTYAQRNQVGFCYFIVYVVCALILAAWGTIWVLVIAFQEDSSNGILCLLVPFYEIYYTITRWQAAKGAFALRLAPAIIFVLMGVEIMVVTAWRTANQIEEGRSNLARREPGSVDGPDGSQAPGIQLRGVRPSFNGPNRQTTRVITVGPGVTIVILGVPNNGDPALGVTARDVSQAAVTRLRALAPEATSYRMTRINDRTTLILAPVNDPQALASRIDIGTATVNGGQIELQLSPDFIASAPRLPAEPASAPSVAARDSRPAVPDPEVPAGADLVTKSLIQLKSADRGKQKDAIHRLERANPDGRVDQVVRALLPLLDEDDDFLVIDTIKALAVWRSPEVMPALIQRSRDNRHFVRSEAIKALGKFQDPKAVEAVVDQLKNDGFAAEAALKDMGPTAEPAVIGLLRNPDPDLRRKACEVLQQVGAQETLKAMQSIPADPDLGVQMAAREAQKQIVARVGPLPRSARGDRAGTKTGASRRTKS
jgi:hypothetical protein